MAVHVKFVSSVHQRKKAKLPDSFFASSKSRQNFTDKFSDHQAELWIYDVHLGKQFCSFLIVYVQDDLKVVTTEKSINLGQVSLKENAFNMCLNGGTFYPGTGCLCIDNYSGDFCDECLPGWIGEKCDNPENMCETTSDSINCYGKWLFNLTLLDMPIGAKELGSIDLGSMGRKVLKDISILKDILLKDIRLPCIRCTHVVIS